MSKGEITPITTAFLGPVKRAILSGAESAMFRDCLQLDPVVERPTQLTPKRTCPWDSSSDMISESRMVPPKMGNFYASGILRETL